MLDGRRDGDGSRSKGTVPFRSRGRQPQQQQRKPTCPPQQSLLAPAVWLQSQAEGVQPRVPAAPAVLLMQSGCQVAPASLSLSLSLSPDGPCLSRVFCFVGPGVQRTRSYDTRASFEGESSLRRYTLRSSFLSFSHTHILSLPLTHRVFPSFNDLIVCYLPGISLSR